jgi:hypothetical protein
MDDNNIKNIVKNGYSTIAKNNSSCCGSVPCCRDNESPQKISNLVGYTKMTLKVFQKTPILVSAVAIQLLLPH